jgi:hypothetical protein
LLGTLLISNVWFAISIWSALYVSDYGLTLWAARLYRMGAKEHLALQGSLEINPYFRDDIDSLRMVSSRFIRSLLFSALAIALAWLISVRWAGVPRAFSILMGALIFLEATAHIRHIRNIAFFRSLLEGRNLSGKIEYPRWLSLRLSSVEILSFSALFLLAFLVSGSWFFIGGVASCLLTGLQHLDWANKATTALEQSDEP